MNVNLQDKEIEDFQNLTNKVLAEICHISDRHNIDRDSALKYYADMLTAFSEVATIQNYNSKQTNADRIRSMTDAELTAFLCRTSSDDEGCYSCLASKYCHRGHTGFEDWLLAESEE